MTFEIRESLADDLESALSIDRAAFGSNDVAYLTRDLMGDPSARPLLSMLAFEDDRAVGHILFTTAHLEPKNGLSISILAPLAVLPDYQNKGIGGKLINTGLEVLSKAGVDLVFVLGHPTYYPRFGFLPAGRLGLKAPYPIPDKDSDAWMVLALKPGLIGNISGRVVCAEKLNRPEHWRE